MIFASPLRSILFRFSGFCGSEFTDRFVFDVFCVLGSGCRVLLLVSSFPPPPPLSAAPSLVDQAALLWHRTRFLSFWVGFGVVPAYFVLPTPPRSVPGAVVEIMGPLICAHDIRIFGLFSSSCRPLSPAGSRGRSSSFGCSDCGTGLCNSLCSLSRRSNFASPPLAKVMALLRFFAFSVATFSTRPPCR